MNRRQVGTSAENFAAAFLEGLGYTILERNWRRRFGEIDIVATRADTLVFFEVKYRSSNRFGAVEEAVDNRKLARLKALAAAYVQSHHARLPYSSTRLAVICVHHSCNGPVAHVIWAD